MPLTSIGGRSRTDDQAPSAAVVDRVEWKRLPYVIERCTNIAKALGKGISIANTASKNLEGFFHVAVGSDMMQRLQGCNNIPSSCMPCYFYIRSACLSSNLPRNIPTHKGTTVFSSMGQTQVVHTCLCGSCGMWRDTTASRNFCKSSMIFLHWHLVVMHKGKDILLFSLWRCWVWNPFCVLASLIPLALC